MSIWIFSEHHYNLEPRTYGGFRVVRETATRYYFEHVMGDPLCSFTGNKPGNAFNYHNEYWLDQGMARRRSIGIVSDEEAFHALVQSHREFDERLKLRRETHDAEMRAMKKDYLRSTSNLRMENDDDEG